MQLKELIEAGGGRAYTEQAAHDAHVKALAGLRFGAKSAATAATALRLLAESLLGRSA